jgi:hypothetical protein
MPISDIIPGMHDNQFVYEARYGLRGRPGIVTTAGLIFAALAALPGMPTWLRAVDIAFFGGGSLVMLAVAATHHVALRVDADGITLGGTPPRYRSGTRFVPWVDIEGVVLWRQHLPYHASMRYLGLMRPPNAPTLTGSRAEAAGRMAAGLLTPGIPADIVMASRAINGWRLDETRLAAAVNHFAPAVTISKRQ